VTSHCLAAGRTRTDMLGSPKRARHKRGRVSTRLTIGVVCIKFLTPIQTPWPADQPASWQRLVDELVVHPLLRISGCFGTSMVEVYLCNKVSTMPVTSPVIQSPAKHRVPPTSTAASSSCPNYAPQSSVCRALNVFADNDLDAPEHDHLELITRFAVQAQLLLFTAAMCEPDQARLDQFFNEFVLACALPAQAS
jgi:hypothetical protein